MDLNTKYMHGSQLIGEGLKAIMFDIDDKKSSISIAKNVNSFKNVRNPICLFGQKSLVEQTV